ncbi:hypothetical protein EDB89DRAFT_1904920 [Lactarius sanguifluus]|nr:hypothetical protein EDB89DRAFT_1904920 [Lactarius sanguifluus]
MKAHIRVLDVARGTGALPHGTGEAKATTGEAVGHWQARRRKGSVAEHITSGHDTTFSGTLSLGHTRPGVALPMLGISRASLCLAYLLRSSSNDHVEALKRRSVSHVAGSKKVSEPVGALLGSWKSYRKSEPHSSSTCSEMREMSRAAKQSQMHSQLSGPELDSSSQFAQEELKLLEGGGVPQDEVLCVDGWLKDEPAQGERPEARKGKLREGVLHWGEDHAATEGTPEVAPGIIDF